jgi:hypothetical protein
MRDCNFLPERYREEQFLRLAVRRRVGCIFLLIAAMGLWWLVHHGRMASAKGMMELTIQQKEQLDILLQGKGAMEAEQEDLALRRDLLAALSAGPCAVSLFDEISGRMPPSVLLTRFALSSDGHLPAQTYHPRPSDEKGSTLTGTDGARSVETPLSAVPGGAQREPVSGPVMVLTGLAANTAEIIQFAASLENSPAIVRVHLRVTGPMVWSGRKAEQFHITCELADACTWRGARASIRLAGGSTSGAAR